MEQQDFRAEICRRAMEWVKANIKYRHRGYTRRGCDCIGLLLGILQEMGYMRNYVLPYYERGWERGEDPDILTRDFSPYYIEIIREELLPSDILLFAFASRIIHSGIYLGDNLFVHCYQGSTVKVDTLKLSPWTSRLVKIVRLDQEKLG